MNRNRQEFPPAMNPSHPLMVPERFECRYGQCRPSTWDLDVTLLEPSAEWLPNDEVWLWRCKHGRPHYLRWEAAITMTEMREAVDVKG